MGSSAQMVFKGLNPSASALCSYIFLVKLGLDISCLLIQKRN